MTREKSLEWIKKVVVLVLLIALIRYFNLSAYVEPLMQWIEGLGMWSAIVFGAIFVVAGGILVPMPLLMIPAGAIYGVFWGTVIISVATVIEGLLLYLIATKMEGRLRNSKLLKNRLAQPIQRMLIDGGWKMIGLLRCLPYMSFVFLSFVCGVSKIKVRDYVLGTWIGMLPVSLTYVYVGVVTKSSLSEEAAATQSMLDQLIMYSGLALAIGISIYITIKANKYFKQYQPEMQVA